MIEHDEYQVPADEIEALARCLLSAIRSYFESGRVRLHSLNGSHSRTPNSQSLRKKNGQADGGEVWRDYSRPPLFCPAGIIDLNNDKTIEPRDTS